MTLMVIFDCVNGILMDKLCHCSMYCGAGNIEKTKSQKSCYKAEPCMLLWLGEADRHSPPALSVRWFTCKDAVSYKEIIRVKWVPDETKTPIKVGN